MTAGKLASVKPAATTDTFLYRAPIDSAASAILNVTNQGAASGSYRVGLRDYDQTLTLNSSSLRYRKGNVVSTYVVSLIPGVTKTSLTSSSLVSLTSGNAQFRFLDVYVDSSIKEIPTKSDSVGTLNLSAAPSGGTIVIGNTLTGAYGLTAKVYAFNSNTNSVSAGIPNITSAASSIYFANITTILAADYVAIPNIVTGTVTYEIVTLGTITPATHLAAVTRGQLGTTAAAHASGASSTIIRRTATNTTLTAAITDVAATSITVASNTGLVVGNYLKIGNELLLIEGIAGTTITVARGQFSTTAATALNGATVQYCTGEGRVIVNYFDAGEALTAGAVGATVSSYSTTNNPFSPSERFVFDVNEDGNFEAPTNISLDIGRTYRFLQSDSSNTNHSLRFQVTGQSTEYTTGVTVNGTAGSAGAYTQIAVSSLTSTNITVTDLDESNYSLPVTVVTDPVYTSIYVYDVDGTLSTGESFSTNSGTNDIDKVYPGPYGYVHGYTSTSLKVSLGLNSSAFAQYTTSVTGTSGTKTITVGSATNLIPGMIVTGTGIAANARIFAISGTTVTLDTANTGAVSGTGTFKHIIYDVPRQSGVNRNLATVVSYTTPTDVNAEDYLFYDKSIASKDTDKNSGIVVGPGQSLVVYSSTTDLNFVLDGFLDSTLDFTIISYSRS